jgi:hypothetical protein
MQDVLKIYYVLLLASDSQEDVTAFQLFSRSWSSLRWMLDRLPSLPGDLLEPSYKFDDVMVQRIGGLRQLAWLPLVLRISEFIPAALRARTRVLSWNEVIGGMLRMLFASEMLNALVGPPDKDGTPRSDMQTAANADINTYEDENWFDNLLKAISSFRNEPLEKVVSRARAVTARAEAIRYVQLGHPEAILIDDGEVLERLKQAANEIMPTMGQHESSI